MAYELFLRHYSRLGVIKNAQIDPIWARYGNDIYNARNLTFPLHIDTVNALANPIVEYDIIVVYIRNKELGIQDSTGGFVEDFTGIIRNDGTRSADANGEIFLTFRAPEQKHILSWRHVLWASNFKDRSTFSGTPAETILKTLVDFNCTSLAVGGPDPTVDRWRDGDLLPGMGVDITTTADAGLGNVVNLSFMGGNLLAVLKRVAETDKEIGLGTGIRSGDWSLTWQGENTNEFVFDWHEGQLGEDKSAGDDRVVFSLQNNTMRNPTLRTFRTGATAAISAGRGQNAGRRFEEVLADAYAADNDLEMFADGRNETTSLGLISFGQERLRERRQNVDLTFDVLQTSDVFYSPVPVKGRKTYKTGDITLASFGGDFQRKITGIAVDWLVPENTDAFLVDVLTESVP